MTYCLDTNTLIFGVKREEDPANTGKVASAAAFIAQVQARGDRLLVPTVAICEMLVACNQMERANLIERMRANFMLADFDCDAAAECAEMEAKLRGAGEASAPELRARRYDLMIAATAKANGADVLVTEDIPLRKLVDGLIAVRGFEEPGTLFDDRD